MDIEKLEAFDSLTRYLFKMNSLMQDWGDFFAGQYNLTTAQWKVLGALVYHQKPMTVPEISHIMGISRQGVQKQVNLLLETDFLEKVENPQHKKSNLYQITTPGQDIYHKIHLSSTNYLEKQAQDFSLQKLTEVNRLLKELTAIYTLSEKRKTDEI